jgi:YVTN family beta-propeller protein
MPANKLKSECFDIVNHDGKAVLFRTNDVSVNKITFKIINLTGGPLKLTGGAPVRQIKGGLLAGEENGASSFQFDFESMLTETVVEHLQLTLPEGWAKRFFPGDSKTVPSWAVAPVNTVVIAPGDFVKFEMGNITCATTKPGNFEIMYRNIEGYENLKYPINKRLTVISPPDPLKKNPKFVWDFINPVHPIRGDGVLEEDEPITSGGDVFLDGGAVPVYISYDQRALIENGFTFILTNSDPNPLGPPKPQTADDDGADAPVLYISFLFGDEDHDVTSQQLADNNITIDVDAKLHWIAAMHAADTPYWAFSPQNHQIMLGKETVKFPIHKIITELNVKEDTISLMYVQFNNIPGHNDAAFAMQLHKKKAVASIAVEANKDRINIGENILLSWTSSLARRVTIQYYDRDNHRIFLDSDLGQIKLNKKDFTLPIAPTAETTTIIAYPYDDVRRKNDDASVTVIQVPATIKTFTATPRLIDNWAKTEVTLSWEVENARSITLTTPHGLETFANNIRTYTILLEETFLFTLKAYSYGQHLPVPDTKAMRVLAFKREQSIVLPVPLGKKQNSPAILVNNRYGRLYVVCNSINTIYDIDVTTLAIVKTYAGYAIVLSDDGSKLFTFNRDSGDRGIVMYDVATGKRSPNLDFLNVPMINAIVTPDLKKLFFIISISNPQGEGVTYVLFTANVDASKNTMSAKSGFSTLGKDPRGLAFNGNASKLYIANYADGTISVINMADGSRMVLQLPDNAKPTNFACKKSANKLYVACEGSNEILIMNTNSNSVSGKIVMNQVPGKILLGSNDKYLYVANRDVNTVTVIDTADDKVMKTITVGNSPFAMAPDKDTHTLFVGNYCSKTLSVVDADNHVEILPQLPTGKESGNPFDVAMYTGDRTYTRVFVAKEDYPQTVTCASPVGNKNLEISVFTIDQQPVTEEDFTT